MKVQAVKENLSEQLKWQAEEDMRMLSEAEKVKNDPKRLKRVMMVLTDELRAKAKARNVVSGLLKSKGSNMKKAMAFLIFLMVLAQVGHAQDITQSTWSYLRTTVDSNDTTTLDATNSNWGKRAAQSRGMNIPSGTDALLFSVIGNHATDPNAGSCKVKLWIYRAGGTAQLVGQWTWAVGEMLCNYKPRSTTATAEKSKWCESATLVTQNWIVPPSVVCSGTDVSAMLYVPTYGGAYVAAEVTDIVADCTFDVLVSAVGSFTGQVAIDDKGGTLTVDPNGGSMAVTIGGGAVVTVEPNDGTFTVDPNGGSFKTTRTNSYSSLTTYLATNGYSGQTADLANDQAYDLGADIDNTSTGYHTIYFWVEHDSNGTTDDIEVSVFSSPNGTDFDDVAFYGPVECTSDGSDDQQGFSLTPVPPHFRIGVRTNGTTDTFDYRIRWIGM